MLGGNRSEGPKVVEGFEFQAILDDQSSKRAKPGMLFVWPKNRIEGKQPATVSAAVPDLKLLPLKCVGWAVSSNPEFNHLVLMLKPGTGRTAEKWRKYFRQLGRSVDVIFETAEFSVRLYRPLCTYGDKHELEFHYLTGQVRLS